MLKIVFVKYQPPTILWIGNFHLILNGENLKIYQHNIALYEK